MTDTPIKKENQTATDNVSSAKPSEQKRSNRNNDRKSRRGDSNERDSEGKKGLFKLEEPSKTVKGGKKMSFRAIVIVGNEKGQVELELGRQEVLLEL